MFTRYLGGGGGIGHLEQFPPAYCIHEDSAINDSSDVEIEIDAFVVGDKNGSNNSGDKGGGNEGEEDEGEEGDEAGVYEEEYDPGELSDEETWNIY